MPWPVGKQVTPARALVSPCGTVSSIIHQGHGQQQQQKQNRPRRALEHGQSPVPLPPAVRRSSSSAQRSATAGGNDGGGDHGVSNFKHVLGALGHAIPSILSGLVCGLVLFVFCCVFSSMIFSTSALLEAALPLGVGMHTVMAPHSFCSLSSLLR